MKLIFSMLLLAAPLLAEDFTGYLEVGIRQDSLRCTSTQGAGTGFLSRLSEKMQTLEMRAGGLFRPQFICDRPYTGNYSFSPATLHLLKNISLGIDGGILLPSHSTSIRLSLQEDAISLLGQSMRACAPRVRGGDGTFYFLHSAYVNAHWNVLAFLGYATEGRNLSSSFKNSSAEEKGIIEDSIRIDDFNYKIFWHGPWIGLGSAYTYYKWNIFGHIAYHRALCHSDSHFELTENFSDDFIFKSKAKLRQKGVMNGVKIRLGALYTINTCWQLALTFKGEYFKTQACRDTGHNKHELSSANTVFGASRMKNKANASLSWTSWAILGGVNYVF